MINKIISFTFLACMFLAIILSSLGIHEIHLDNNFYFFFNMLSNKFESWDNIKIPNIPLIPDMSNGGSDILSVLRNIVNAIVTIINILGVGVTNILIQVIKFFVALIVTIKDYIDFVKKVDSERVVNTIQSIICAL